MQKDRDRTTQGGDQGILSSCLAPLKYAIRQINYAVAAFVRWVIMLFYRPPLDKYLTEERFQYFSCGAGNYIIIDSLLYFFIYHYIIADRYINIGISTLSPHVSSLIIVFPITFFIGFWLNRYVVFQSTSRTIRFQMARYTISVVGSIILSYLILKFLVEYVGMWATPAKILCSLTTAVYSYIMARHFTFIDKKEAESGCVQTK